MEDGYFTLMQQLAPDLAQEIELRALVLERIGALQPVGRRQLAARLNLPEREVRTVATLLKKCTLPQENMTNYTISFQEVLVVKLVFMAYLRVGC